MTGEELEAVRVRISAPRFDDVGDGSERDGEVLAKAQANAVRRITALIRQPD